MLRHSAVREILEKYPGQIENCANLLRHSLSTAKSYDPRQMQMELVEVWEKLLPNTGRGECSQFKIVNNNLIAYFLRLIIFFFYIKWCAIAK